MKKTFTIILTLILAAAIAVSTSGCINTGPIATEKHKQLMLSLLKEKYGEGFKVLTIKYDISSGFSGGLAPGSGHYDAVCCPKSNEEILFKASVCKNGTMISSDDYPHAVVKHLVKEEVEKVISEYSDNYALDIYFREPSKYNCEDEEWGREFLNTVTPFTKASDITIESYSEKYLETSFTNAYVIFDGNEYAEVESLQQILDNNFKTTFHKLPINIIFHFTNEAKVDKIKTMLEDPSTIYSDFRDDLVNEYPKIYFRHNKNTEYKFSFQSELSKFN